MCGMVLRSGSVGRSFVRSGTVRAVVFSRVSKTWQMSARWINEDEEKRSYKGGGGQRHPIYTSERADECGFYAMHVGHETWRQLGVLHASASGSVSVTCVGSLRCRVGEGNTMGRRV